MNKSELIDAVASDAGVSKADAKRVLESFTDTVSKTLAGGDDVTIIGFGTFSVSKRPARVGRNPQTGESMNIAAKNVAKFKAGAKLKDAVN